MATPGMMLGGRYRLIDVLGDGGMARVYRAEDERLSRIVAIKMLHQQYVGQAEFVRRFEQEARLAAGLSHPNIVAIYDVGRDDDAYFIVMEYVEGSSLKPIIARDAPLSLERSVVIMRQLGGAIDYAHAHGIIHRDIKPENILLTPDDHVKVSDFGIARALTTPGQTATGMVLGSVSYFSPEQAQGQPATAESDLYSTGIVLYEMLTGHLPFAADNPLATAMQHLTQQPAAPRTFVPALPSAVDGVVLKALSKPPEARYHSGAALAEALAMAASRPSAASVAHAARGAAAGGSIAQVHAARTVRMARTPLSPVRRRSAALPLLIIVALGGGAIFAATHGFQLTNQATGGSQPTPTPTVAASSSPSSTPPGGATPTQAAAGGGSAPGSTATQSASATPTRPATATATSSSTSSATTSPTATGQPSRTSTPVPTKTARAGSHGNGGITAQIVTARSHDYNASGEPVAVDPRDSFTVKAGQANAILHLAHVPHNAKIAARWTFPDGRGVDIALPSGFSTFWTVEQFAGPGHYTVSAVVNGKVVGSHPFVVHSDGHAAAAATPAATSQGQGTLPAGLPVTQQVEASAGNNGNTSSTGDTGNNGVSGGNPGHGRGHWKRKHNHGDAQTAST